MAYSQLHEESQDAIDQEYGAYLQSFLKNQLYPLLWKQLHESLPVEEIRGLRLPNPKPTTYRLKVQRRDTRATRPRIRLARTHTCADRELHNELHECWQGYVVPVVEASQCSSSSSTEPRESAPEPLEGSNSSRCDLACSETLDFGESNEENPGASGADVNFNLPAFFNKKPDTLDEGSIVQTLSFIRLQIFGLTIFEILYYRLCLWTLSVLILSLVIL